MKDWVRKYKKKKEIQIREKKNKDEEIKEGRKIKSKKTLSKKN